MEQILFNGLVGLCVFLLGWWSKLIWTTIKDLETANEKLLEKIQAIQVHSSTEYASKADLEKVESKICQRLSQNERLEVRMAENYATRHDLTELGKSIFNKLDQVLERLDRKADKAGGG